MKEKIENFFDYRWNNNPNSAIHDQTDKDLLDQLPNDIQRKIYTDFLFMGFLQNFRKYFCIPNLSSMHKNSFYSWDNQEY